MSKERRTSPIRTIFVIEDEDGIRLLIVTTLRKKGFRVIEARDGSEASLVWEQEKGSVDLVISDLTLPGKTGYELALEFRATRPDVKIIFESGNTKDNVQETSHIIRGAKFLLKPFSIATLMEAVEAMLAT